MTIELKEGNYYAAFVYVYPGKPRDMPTPVDWMGCVYKEGAADDSSIPWHVVCRTRVYLDDKTFDSKDKKHWSHLAGAGDLSEEAVMAKLKSVAEEVAAVLGTRVNFSPVQGDHDKALKILSLTDYANLKIYDIEEKPELEQS